MDKKEKILIGVLILDAVVVLVTVGVIIGRYLI